jgi:hypothetical protein
VETEENEEENEEEIDQEPITLDVQDGFIGGSTDFTEGAPACNVNRGGDDPYWVTDTINWMKDPANNVMWACYFNSTPNRIDPADWAPLSRAAFSAAWNAS